MSYGHSSLDYRKKGPRPRIIIGARAAAGAGASARSARAAIGEGGASLKCDHTGGTSALLAARRALRAPRAADGAREEGTPEHLTLRF